MYSTIKIDVLEEMLTYPAEGLYMGNWWCGTSGCLVGTYCHRHGDESSINRLDAGMVGRTVEHVTGLPTGFSVIQLPGGQTMRGLREGVIAAFLFTASVIRIKSPDASDLSGVMAKRRLQKALAYIKRKKALWEEYEHEMSLSKKDRRLREEKKWPVAKRGFAITLNEMEAGNGDEIKGINSKERLIESAGGL